MDFQKWAAVAITLIGGGFLLYLLCHFLLGLLMPFLIAFLLAALTRPIARFLAARTGGPLRVCAALAVLLFLLLFSVLFYLLCLRLSVELQRLFDFLAKDSANENGRIAQLFRFFSEWGARVPLLSRLQNIAFFKNLFGDPKQYLATQLQKLLGELAGKLTGGVAALLGRLPGIFLFLVVTLIACFYFALEYDKVCDVFLHLLPPSLRERFPEYKARFLCALKRCVKAYFFLFLLTFGELFLGFFLLRVGYPFLLAALIATLDVLPVLGVGTVLIPWAILALLTGGTARGVGLLILYGVITVVRQIAEPHFVGKSIGLHPILMLTAFYVGLSLFGVIGLLVGPVLALLCKLLFERASREEKS